MNLVFVSCPEVTFVSVHIVCRCCGDCVTVPLQVEDYQKWIDLWAGSHRDPEADRVQVLVNGQPQTLEIL